MLFLYSNFLKYSKDEKLSTLKRKEKTNENKNCNNITLIVCIITRVVKEESCDFSLVPYNVTTSCEFNDEIGGAECLNKALDGNFLVDNLITDSKVYKNDIIMILLHLNPSNESQLSNSRMVLNYDKSKLLLGDNDGYEESSINDRIETRNGGILPLNNNKTNWRISLPNYLENGKILIFMNNDDSIDITNHIIYQTLNMKLNNLNN